MDPLEWGGASGAPREVGAPREGASPNGGAPKRGPLKGEEGRGGSEGFDIEKHFVFTTSLLHLQFEGPVIPGSDPPCSHCKSKRLKCICYSVQLVGK